MERVKNFLDAAVAELDILLSPHQVQEWIGLSTKTLQKRRTDGTGPKFIKVGNSVRYRWSDVEKWLEAHSASSTAEVSANNGGGL